MMAPISGDSNWRAWPELKVKLHDVPPGTTTWDLYRVFDGEGGKIDSVEIFENARGRGLTSRIRFIPPPAKAFWETGLIRLQSEGEQSKVVPINVEAPRRMQDGRVQSPVHPRVWYPAITKFFPTSMSFGVMPDETTMLCMNKIKSAVGNEGDEGVRLSIDLIRKKVDVSFSIQMERGRFECYKFSLEFATLKRVYVHHVADNTWEIVIPTDYPPAYFWKRGDLEETFAANRLAWSSRDMWCRTTDIRTDTTAVYNAPISLANDPDDPNFVNLGRWTSFRFLLESNEKLVEVVRALGDFNIETEAPYNFRVKPFESGTSFWSVLDPRYEKNADKNLKTAALLADTTDTQQPKLSFEVRYQLEVCISRGIFSEYRLGPDFLVKLLELDNTAARQLLEHLSDVGNNIPEPMCIFDDGDVLTTVSIKSKPVVYNDRVIARKVMVTPTAMYLTSATPEIANRILRKYRDIQDRFLRVQFTGELLEGRINSRADTDRDDEVYKRVYRVLAKGIRIGDRHFEFLAFGNSQMRENGAYFFAPTENVSCADIRRAMGSFGHIKSVAKYAARMGQCFSTTREVRAVNVPNIQSISDIENEQRYCFTDGVGKTSKLLADLAANEMGLGFHLKPSAYQFRMGGCKGVLTVWPDAKKSEVHIRKSQEKFVSQFNGLEIIRCAQFATATLNRQTITILSSLGVRNEAFVGLLDKHLTAHTKAEIDSRDAITLLRQHVDKNQTTLVLADILLHGFKEPDVQEPFVLSILNLWKTWSLKLVKEKARIPIEKSAFILGCADETGTLRGHSKSTEGSKVKDVSKLPQIFLQISDPEEPQKSTVVAGVCIVGRNPSLHPGDIRVVEAVDVSALRHLRDVVVFPTKGDRDVPSMLSGGDLDGDDFFVIWDPDLLPPEWNHPPMEHLPVKPKILNRGVQTKDLRAFFVKYMKNDILPTVALAHLALADYYDDGAKNEKCKCFYCECCQSRPTTNLMVVTGLALAQLHSKAVDYVKSGEPAEMDKSLRPRSWPTFMEKRVPKEATYRSQKALGIVYDKVHSVVFDPTYTGSFDKRILDKCVKDNELLKKARHIKTQYDTALRRIMGQREIATEFEIWSGFVLSRPRVGSGYKLQEDVGRDYGSIKLAFREMCQEAAGGASPTHIDPFVAAMYKVTEEEVNIALHERRGATNIAGRIFSPRNIDAKSMPLISFPWIFHEVLCRLATETGMEAPREKQPREEKHAWRGSLVDAGNEEKVAYLDDGRIVHRGEVLNLFDATEEEEELANWGRSDMTTQAKSDLHIVDPRSETRSETGSNSSRWLPPDFKIKIRKRGPGEPDIQARMMSQIQRNLAEMRLGKQPGWVAEGASVSVTERGTGMAVENEQSSEVSVTKELKAQRTGKQRNGTERAEVNRSNQLIDFTFEEDNCMSFKVFENGREDVKGKKAANGACSDLDGARCVEGVSADIEGKSTGVDGGKGNGVAEKENRPNSSTSGGLQESNDTKTTGVSGVDGTNSKGKKTQRAAAKSTAAAAKVRAEFATGGPPEKGAHQSEAKGNTGTVDEARPPHLAGAGTKPAGSKDKSAGEVPAMTPGAGGKRAKSHQRGKSKVSQVKVPKRDIEKVVEVKELNAVDLPLEL